MVFRPFVGEVLVGTLTSSSSEGLRGNVSSCCDIHPCLLKIYVFSLFSVRDIFIVECLCINLSFNTLQDVPVRGQKQILQLSPVDRVVRRLLMMREYYAA